MTGDPTHTTSRGCFRGHLSLLRWPQFNGKSHRTVPSQRKGPQSEWIQYDPVPVLFPKVSNLAIQGNLGQCCLLACGIRASEPYMIRLNEDSLQEISRFPRFLFEFFSGFRCEHFPGSFDMIDSHPKTALKIFFSAYLGGVQHGIQESSNFAENVPTVSDS